MKRDCSSRGWLKKPRNRTRDVDILSSKVSRMGLKAMWRSKWGTFCRHNRLGLPHFLSRLTIRFRLWSAWTVKLWRRSGPLAFLPPCSANTSTFPTLACSPLYEQKTSAFHENQFDLLPEEIVINILLYLPVQSLRLCKLVCVDWCRIVHKIISTKEFRVAHMTRTLQVQRDNISKLNQMVNYDVSYLIHNRFKSHFVENGLFYEAEAIYCNIDGYLGKKMGFHYYDIVGSCNGLLLLCNFLHIPICICNPITLKHMDVPSIEVEFSFSFSGMLCGFGFAPLSRKYKVVRMDLEERDAYRYTELEDECNVHVSIWTVGADKWRRIGLAPSTIPPSPKFLYGIHVNGTLYWLFETSDLEIIALDLESEELREIALPPNLSKKELQKSTLCNFMERLALVRSTEETIFIWQMVPHQGWNQTILPNQNPPRDPIVQHVLICCSNFFLSKSDPYPWHRFRAISHVEVLTSPSEALEAIQEREGAF